MDQLTNLLERKPSIDKNGKVSGDDGYNASEGELTSAYRNGMVPWICH